MKNSIVVIDRSDGTYVVTGSSISSFTEGLDNTSDDIKALNQKLDDLSTEYGKYLNSKQCLDGFIIFGIFVIVGLIVGKYLYGLFNN